MEQNKQRKFDCIGSSGEYAGSLVPKPTETVEPSNIVGEAFPSSYEMMQALPSYPSAPHLSFANIPVGDYQTALRFVCNWGPLNKSQYVGRFDPEDPGAPMEFMVPLQQFWSDQKKVLRLIEIYSRYCAGEYDDKVNDFTGEVTGTPNDADEMHSLLNILNQLIAKHKPSLEFIPEANAIFETVPGGLLIELLFCIRNDIIGNKRILNCADPNCNTFFHPSRPSQVYHTQACLQRHHARERMRATRQKKRKRKNK